MAQLQFLDSSGLKSVLNKIKNTFVPKSRKIANIDLNNDITAEELGNNLKDYVGGKSAYEVAVDNGFVGSERRWLESLKGENAYELAQQDGFSGTEEEWLESLKGESGVYVGSGDMPENCNVQIDPEGETLDISDIIDKTYTPESENAQSGIAVAEAIESVGHVKLTFSSLDELCSYQYKEGVQYLIYLNFAIHDKFGYKWCDAILTNVNFLYIKGNKGRDYADINVNLLHKQVNFWHIYDNALNENSEFAVQNKVVAKAINEINSQLDGLENLLSNI